VLFHWNTAERLTAIRHHVHSAGHAVAGLYIGGLSQITIILWLWGGQHGAYRVYHSRSPLVSLPTHPLPLDIYREFAIYQINIVSTESVLVVVALISALALSTSRSAHPSPSRHSLRIVFILVGLSAYPHWRSISFMIPLDFHSEHQSLHRSACGMLWPRRHHRTV
jgi:hypothetical protein